MLNFRRSGRNRSKDPQPGEKPDTTCPFLARTIAENRTHICLSSEEPLAISRRYVDSYCLTEDHAHCSLFLAAYRASNEAREPEPALQGLDMDTLLATASVIDSEQSAREAEVAAPDDVTAEIPVIEEATAERDVLEVVPAAAGATPLSVDDVSEPAQSDEQAPTEAPVGAAETPGTVPEMEQTGAETTAGIEADAPVAAAPVPLTEDQRREAIQSDAHTLLTWVEALQARLDERAAALAELAAQIQRLEGDPIAGNETSVEATLQALDDARLESVTAAVRAVHDSPNSLHGYMGITQEAPVLEQMVATLLQFIPETSPPS